MIWSKNKKYNKSVRLLYEPESMQLEHGSEPTVNVKGGRMVSGAGAVGSHAGIVSAMAGGCRSDRQERGTRSHFRGHDSEMRRVAVEPVKVPLDIKRQVALRHVTVELHRLTGEHRLVRLERYDVRCDCRRRMRIA